MKTQRFSLIDVETTGGGISGNRITEICIASMEGDKVISKFTSLVNPECDIPPYITALTGITNDMVEDAPTFKEIAHKILDITEGTVFVAHNVNFDYNVIRGEFQGIGEIFTRKKLCTVRLSRILIPKMYSYSLGKLCTSLGIPHFNKHRAEGDVDATVFLFQQLLSLDIDYKVFKSFLNPRSKQASLPPHLPMEQIEALPDKAGIYLFKNKKEQIIYAGKAKNIKKRVISHFYDKKSSEYHLGQETFHIEYETTGNELLALLLESEHIRKYFPKYNKAQKFPTSTFQIISYVNQRGIIQLALSKTKVLNDSVSTFYSRAEAIEKLEEICGKYKLCPRFCTLQSTSGKCSHYKINSCEGVCEETETVEAYNLKVKAALDYIKQDLPSFIIKGQGRTADEIGFALVYEGQYQGFGYIDPSASVSSIDDLQPFLQKQIPTYHTHLILRSFLKRNGEKNVLRFGNMVKEILN